MATTRGSAKKMSEASDSAPRSVALLDVREAADRLRLTDRHVRQLIAERRLPHVRIGRYIRVDSRDLEHFVANLRVAGLR